MKRLTGKIAFLIVLIMFASTLSSCVLLEMAVGFAQLGATLVVGVAETGAAIGGAINDAAVANAEERRWQKMTPEELEQERKKEWDHMTLSDQEWFEKMEKYKEIDTF